MAAGILSPNSRLLQGTTPMKWNLKTVRRMFRPSPHRTIRNRTHLRLYLENLEKRLAPAVDVLSWRGSVAGNNSGVNNQETQLTPSTVNLASFGQLFNSPVDG